MKVLNYKISPLMVETAANIVNIPEIDKKIQEFIKEKHITSEKISKWLTSVFKKWLINEGKTKKAKLGPDQPQWVLDAKKRGDELVELVFEQDLWENKLSGVSDYLQADPDSIPDLQRVAVKDMLAKTDAWHARLAKNIEKEEKKEENKIIKEDGISKYRKYKDGFSWVSVKGAEALNREGRIMGHCVGDYYSRVKEGHLKIYSLRDPENMPHITVEVTKDGEVRQVKGKANKEVVKRYEKYAEDFLIKSKVPWKKINQDGAPTTPKLLEFFLNRKKKANSEKKSGKKKEAINVSKARPAKELYQATLEKISRLHPQSAKSFAKLFKLKTVAEIKKANRASKIVALTGFSYLVYDALYGLSIAYKKYPVTVKRFILESVGIARVYRTMLIAPWVIGTSTRLDGEVGRGSVEGDRVAADVLAEFKKNGLVMEGDDSGRDAERKMRQIAMIILRNEVAKIEFTKKDLKYKGANASAKKLIEDKLEKISAVKYLKPKELFKDKRAQKLLGLAIKKSKAGTEDLR